MIKMHSIARFTGLKFKTLKFYKSPFLILGPLFIAGVILGGIFTMSYTVPLIIILFLVGLIILLKKTGHYAFAALLFAGFVLLGAEIMSSKNSFGDSKVEEGSTVVLDVEEAENTEKTWKKAIGTIQYSVGDQKLDRCSERVLIFVKDQLSKGDRVIISTDFIEIKNANNPGEFNAKSYWNNKGIRKMAFVGEADYKIVSHNPPKGLSVYFDNSREYLGGLLEKGFEGEQLSVAKALLLGDKSELSIETKESFSNTGAMHVLAVSGLHVGIIMYLLMFVLGKFSRIISKKTSLIICLLFIWCYACLTGLSPSVMRAAFMFSILLIGQVTSRGTNSINVLFFSAFVILVFDPLLIYDIGFQLSYLAVLGILVMFDSVNALIFVPNKWIRKIWEGTAVGLSAQVFTFPLSLYYFHQFPNYFFISNLGIMILAGVLLTIGFLFFLLSSFFSLRWMLIVLLGFGLNLLLFFIQLIERIPGAVASGFDPSQGMIVLIYVLIIVFLIWQSKKTVRTVIGFIAIVVLMSFQMNRYENMIQDEVVFYNSNVPVISIKHDDQILCFHMSKKTSMKKVEMLMKGYSSVRPGSVSYHQMKEGKTTVKNKEHTIELTVLEGNVYLELNDQTYFFRTHYQIEERLVDKVIDMPYLNRNSKNYSLSEGPFIINLK